VIVRFLMLEKGHANPLGISCPGSKNKQEIADVPNAEVC